MKTLLALKKQFTVLGIGALLTLGVISGLTQNPQGRGFTSPELAIKSLRTALAEKNLDELRKIFGPEINDIINPDLVEATNEFVKATAALDAGNSLVASGTNRFILQYGADQNLFPVPIVQTGGEWYFDTAAGVEELVNRRIGRNELEVLDVIRTYVQAQREYASADRDDDEVLEYAQKFGSTPGQKDGLYWDPDLDGTISPLGPLVAEAEEEGHRKRKDVARQPFHGYYFKILTRQGKHAPGGAYDYIINGNMIGGFGLIAWPAEYDVTGVMTFIVNQQGRVFQRDLGAKSNEIADAITSYDPDKSWSASAD